MNNKTKTLLKNYTHSENKKKFYSQISFVEKISLLHILSKKQQKEILGYLTEDEILDIFKFLDPDEVTDYLIFLNEKKQSRIISKLNSSTRKKVNFLLKFTPESAAGLMNLNYILVSNQDSKKEIEERIKTHLNNGKKEPTILVLDEEEHLLGEMRITKLLFNTRKEMFSNLKELPSVIYNKDQEEVIDIFKKNKHEKIIVFDENNSIIGLIHAKDIFKVIEQENTEDFYAISGLHKEEDITDNPLTKVKFRIGWLVINLATAFLAAFVVSQFQNTISKLVLLAAFMPVIAGMGGNAGTQTTAIIVRSLTLKTIDSKLGRKILINELSAGIINGLIIGIIVTLIAYIFNQNLLFGLVAGSAILINLIIASVFGTLVPLILKAFNFDPASSSTVFVTTSTDVFGFLTFLGLATIVLL